MFKNNIMFWYFSCLLLWVIYVGAFDRQMQESKNTDDKVPSKKVQTPFTANLTKYLEKYNEKGTIYLRDHHLINNTMLNHTISQTTLATNDTSDNIESGAVTRAVMVFVAISVLFLLYVGFKTYRRKNIDKTRIVVHKYGVRARRSDVEMVPLPLSEDEDDETLFDLTATRGNS